MTSQCIKLKIYECIDCGGKVRELVPPKEQRDICPECGKDKVNPLTSDYIDVGRQFKCEGCKRTYTGNTGFGFSFAIGAPASDLKEYVDKKQT